MSSDDSTDGSLNPSSCDTERDPGDMGRQILEYFQGHKKFKALEAFVAGYENSKSGGKSGNSKKRNQRKYFPPNRTMPPHGLVTVKAFTPRIFRMSKMSTWSKIGKNLENDPAVNTLLRHANLTDEQKNDYRENAGWIMCRKLGELRNNSVRALKKVYFGEGKF